MPIELDLAKAYSETMKVEATIRNATREQNELLKELELKELPGWSGACCESTAVKHTPEFFILVIIL